jgi:glucosamine 6-phosphate synthetase-like amidotransferase/phosphosugar isomerase protein
MSSEMLKNIQEQPDVVKRCLNLELSLLEPLQNPESLQLLACGSSYHAALVAQFWFEQLAGKSTTVFDAANMADRHIKRTSNNLLILLSQSGTTADVINNITKINPDRKIPTLGITNQSNTPLHQICNQTIQTPAGDELAVAATKSFISQLILLLRISLAIDSGSNSDIDRIKEYLNNHLIQHLEEVVKATKLEITANHISLKNKLVILGDGINFPIALEGALKVKETTYIPAEGASLGSFMHGPIAIIEPGFPVIVILKQGFEQDSETLQKLTRLRTYGAYIVGITSQSHALFDTVLQVPETPDLLEPIINVVPLQLLAHQIAQQRGLDIDRPRHLTKSIDQ